MKRVVLLLLGVFFIACELDQSTSIMSAATAEDLEGKWKLTATSFDIGDGTERWNNVENGFEYQFRSDGTFLSDRLNGCSGGSYSVGPDGKVTLRFNCASGTQEYIEAARISDRSLYVQPISPVMCIERCTYRFTKM